MPLPGPQWRGEPPREIQLSGSSIVPVGRTLHISENTNQAPELPNAGYSCVMYWEESTATGMPKRAAPGETGTTTAQGGGERREWKFDPDPIKIGWSANANISVMPTRGGQVAYSTGRMLGPLTITGYVRSRWDLLDMADFIYHHMEAALLRGRPLRFIYPERNFDFGLYISNFNEIGLDGEVGEIVGYTITAQITQDFTALTQAKVSQLLPGIPENVEWIDVESAAKIAEKRFKLIVPQGGGTGGTPAEPPAEEGEPTDPEAAPPEGEETPPEEETPKGAPKPAPRSDMPKLEGP